MLVLSRQRDESIVIGDNIVITIVDIRGDKVRLGIEAPTEIPVHRQEVYDAIQRENLKASRLEPQDVRRVNRGDGRERSGGRSAL
jgi:carbon storage regulator